MTGGLVSFGSGPDQDTSKWMAAVTAAGGSVGATQTTRIDTLIRSLKAAGAFGTPYIERMYLFIGENDIHQPQIDIINRVVSTFHGTGAFSTKWGALTGYTGNGSDNYIDPSYRTAGGSFGLNSGSFIAQILNSRTAAQSWDVMGTHYGPSDFISPINGSGSYYAPMDRDGITGAASSLSNAQGTLIATRTDANTASLYQAGAQKATTAACPAPSSIPNMPIFFGSSSDTADQVTYYGINYSGDTFGILGIGGGMLSAMSIAVQLAMNAYTTSWGVNVP